MSIPAKELRQIKGIAYNIYRKSFNTIEFDDLYQEGVLAYLLARKSWDKNRNDYFMGYAYKRIYGAILDFVGNNSLNKRNTIRPSLPKVDYKIVPSVEGMEDNGIADIPDILEVVEVDRVKGKFYEYINRLTALEQEILYSYFITQETMVKIGDRVQINRLKIKTIIQTCVSYLRRYYNPEKEYEPLNIKALSKI